MTEPEEIETAESFDEEDVRRVAAGHTGDGKGDEDPGPSTFQSFAMDDVEKDDE